MSSGFLAWDTSTEVGPAHSMSWHQTPINGRLSSIITRTIGISAINGGCRVSIAEWRKPSVVCFLAFSSRNQRKVLKMATGQHPYQAICIKSEDSANGPRNLLFGACGPNIFAVNLEDGSIVSKWSSEDVQPSVSHTIDPGQKSSYSLHLAGTKWQ